MSLCIYNYDYNSLVLKFQELGFSKLDAKRVYPWLYKKNCHDFSEMSDLPKQIRDSLCKLFNFELPKCVNLQTSIDGTQKALLELCDGQKIENVIIRDEKRVTLCMSTQVGCAMGCKFCNTGTQSLTRNLSVCELIGQVLFWNNFLENTNEKITHIVVMGMGEPFSNYNNLCSWLKIMLDKNGLDFSRHKITVSTSGITDYLEDFAKKFQVQLAVSLHASNDQIRDRIMPINKAYNIGKILDSVKNYPQNSHTSYVTFEYLMLKNINDSIQNARELCKILSKINCRVNLIMFNEWNGCSFLRCDRGTVEEFQNEIKKHKIICTIRKSKGNDILAACGQLKSKHDR